MSTLHELLSSSGLARVSSEIGKVALPSIRLTTHPVEESQIQVGCSKFGGSPDLSQGTRWPEYNGTSLPFIAQFNLAEVAAYDTAHLLPTTGMLAFFFDQDAFFERRAITWHVHYSPDPLSNLHRIPLPENIAEEGRYRPSGVAFTTEITLPDYSPYDNTSVERLGLSGLLTVEEEQAYYRLTAQLANTVGAKYHIPIHRLLGHPDVVQWDMHRDLAGKPADWQLLFQIDSDDTPATDWGDTGRIYYWIRTRGLAEGNFSQVQVILQST